MRFCPAALLSVLIAGAGSACQAAPDPAGRDGAAHRAQEAPFNRQAPNAPSQQPAFPGQTRAPLMTTDTRFEVRQLVEGLDHPWGMAFLPDGRMLVTERPGRLRIVTATGAISPPVAGLPDVDSRGQGGLLDVALDPAFASNRLVYWSYAQPRGSGGNGTAVARGRLSEQDGQARITDAQVIFEQQPALDSTKHFGSRLVFGRDGNLFVTLGERSIIPGRMQARQLDSLLGKVARIRPDGSAPSDNPFIGEEGARPQIWSLGHRNIQAAALHPDTGQLWEVEHGARGGDEVNIVRKGRDYGWPAISYGVEYSGEPITGGDTARDGMEQPVYYWDPVIAPSGMTFYTGDLFPQWRGSLFVGGLASQSLVRLTLDGERVAGEERLLTDRGDRIRDVEQGPDGAIYLLTDEAGGKVLKLVPAG